ncbi:FAD1 flavin adenine dinucleotide synthetase [Balamuthia mandrillaris]
MENGVTSTTHRRAPVEVGEAVVGGHLGYEAPTDVASVMRHYAQMDILQEIKTRLGGNHELLTKVSQSLETINKALDQYQAEGVALSFNGGKDCTVLLHLLLYTLAKRTPATKSEQPRLRAIYFLQRDTFAEVSQFVQSCVEWYNLDMITSDKGFKEGLESILKENSNIRAIFMGTRRTDPNAGSLTPFAETDKGWPCFIRVNPILDWDYSDVWTFLLSFGIPYCSLYDQGYTSIGDTTNTVPNPALSMLENNSNNSNKTNEAEHEGEEKKVMSYAPAHCLTDGNREREGRLSK